MADWRSFRTHETSAVLTDFAELSAIGATPRGGVQREAASLADAETKQWLWNWLLKRGFEIRVDAIGNMFGLYEWTPNAPYILLGSHMDSQPAGGRFDGAYGVLAAAHAADQLRRAVARTDTTFPYNVAVVNWFNEEGSRFQPSMMGSGVFTGNLDLGQALRTEDTEGRTVAAALAEIGFAGTEQMAEVVGYAEVHVEQGRVLENTGDTIGLVQSNWAAHKYHVIVHGYQSHTGSTTLADRQDALLGAARIVVAAREIADSAPEEQLHTSVGQLTVLPNSPVVVARQARLHLDLRSPDPEVLADADRRLRQELSIIEQDARVRIELVKAHSWNIEPYPQEGIKLANSVAESLGLPRQTMLTLAGHDSTNMKDLVPTVMLFVPSTEGIAHNEDEHTSDKDLIAGVDMLTGVAERMCVGELTR